MATEGENTSVSHADMFEAAFEQPTTETVEQQPAAEPAQAQEGQPRDEHGRFAPKAEAQPPEPAPEAPVQAQQADHRIPLAEHLSVRERAQAAERERDQFRQQMELMQRQLAQLQQPQRQPEPPPNVFENPEGYQGHIDQRFQTIDQRLRMQEVNFSLRLAHREHKQDFEQAYQAAINARQMGDPAIDAILASADPGESLMRWHKSRSLYDKTGGNLEAYIEAQIQERLKDPAFLAKAIEAARGQAQQQPNSQAPVVDLPPSLTRTPGSSAAQSGTGMALGGQEQFDAAFR